VLSRSSTIVVAGNQAFCNLAEEAVILDLKAGVYYGLNSVGARVWDLIQKPKTVEQVRDAILEEYDVDLDRCERDLLVLLQDLVGRELVRATKDETAA
jgi:Coenzyme PQQ synthesis protein D (PqqD)